MRCQAGYYNVRIAVNNMTFVHTVHATSDYGAAVKVCEATGLMPRMPHDIDYIRPMRDTQNSVRMH